MNYINLFFTLFWFNLCSASSYYNESKCGTFGPVEDADFESKIMGGSDVSEGQYPFVVGIFNNNNYICTGTLISPRHVLTAAHCFASSESQTFLDKKCLRNQTCLKKYLGSEEKEKCQNGYLNESKIIQNYEIGYNSSNLNDMIKIKVESIDKSYKQFFHFGCLRNDFAILMLVLDGQESKRPYVCLPHTTGINIRDDIQVSSLGWGKDPIKKLERHEKLQKITLGTLMSTKRCLDPMESWSQFPVDGICVHESDSKNTCDGDSGGPLIATQEIPNQKKQFRHVLLGILSFGTNCDDLRLNTIPKTAVYTRMDFYQQKFNEMIGWKNDNFDGFDFNGLY